MMRKTPYYRIPNPSSTYIFDYKTNGSLTHSTFIVAHRAPELMPALARPFGTQIADW
jgi:hypothetical protein